MQLTLIQLGTVRRHRCAANPAVNERPINNSTEEEEHFNSQELVCGPRAKLDWP